MNATYEKDQLSISVSWLLDQMSLDQKKELVERLACENDIIEHVASQIATGYTASCSSGSRGCGSQVEPSTPLDKARRLLALSAGEVAKKELEDAFNTMRHNQAWHDYYRDWAFQMYHAWGKQSQCPDRAQPPAGRHCQYEVVKKTQPLETEGK